MVNAKVIFLFAIGIGLAACRPESPSAVPQDQPQAVSTAVATSIDGEPAQVPDHAPEGAPAGKPVAGALKSPLPEGFELPFGFHRLYDNTGRSENGGPQRRILVEYLDVDDAVVRTSLVRALEAKGFGAPVASEEGRETRLAFAREDGATVIAKVTAGREQPRAAGAKGTLHLVWNSN